MTQPPDDRGATFLIVWAVVGALSALVIWAALCSLGSLGH